MNMDFLKLMETTPKEKKRGPRGREFGRTDKPTSDSGDGEPAPQKRSTKKRSSASNAKRSNLTKTISCKCGDVKEEIGMKLTPVGKRGNKAYRTGEGKTELAVSKELSMNCPRCAFGGYINQNLTDLLKEWSGHLETNTPVDTFRAGMRVLGDQSDVEGEDPDVNYEPEKAMDLYDGLVEFLERAGQESGWNPPDEMVDYFNEWHEWAESNLKDKFANEEPETEPETEPDLGSAPEVSEPDAEPDNMNDPNDLGDGWRITNISASGDAGPLGYEDYARMFSVTSTGETQYDWSFDSGEEDFAFVGAEGLDIEYALEKDGEEVESVVFSITNDGEPQVSVSGYETEAPAQVSDEGESEGDVTPEGVSVVGIAAGQSAQMGGVGEEVASALGTLVIQSDGTYTYTLHDEGPAGRLSPGQTVEDLFTYVIQDATGNREALQLTVEVNGDEEVEIEEPDPVRGSGDGLKPEHAPKEGSRESGLSAQHYSVLKNNVRAVMKKMSAKKRTPHNVLQQLYTLNNGRRKQAHYTAMLAHLGIKMNDLIDVMSEVLEESRADAFLSSFEHGLN